MAKINVSDVVRKFLEEKGVKHVFLLSGGMMMNLLDSISKSTIIKYVCNHHEQACSIAAEAYARAKEDIGVCYATSGPGATNTVTGIAGAWLDSTPVIFITGQSRTTLTVRGVGIRDLRMMGNFEVDIVEIVKPITKYAAVVDNPYQIMYHLEQAFYLATEGRPGPVLLDIPLDIQGTIVEENELIHFSTPPDKVYDVSAEFEKLGLLLLNSNKPVIIAGNGIRASGQVNNFIRIIEQLKIPVVLTQLANDILAYNHPLYVGKVGLRGDRAGNFAVQGADLVISIGSSLHVTTTGYDLEDFAPKAQKVEIDIDKAVLEKNKSISQLQINCDIKTCLSKLEFFSTKNRTNFLEWTNKLINWKNKFQIVNEPHFAVKDEINTYYLVDLLSQKLLGNETIITDAGSLYYIMGQAFKTKVGQRVIVSGALGAMGFALPASIGAAFANPDKNIVCITGDGSMQLNVQELQTISHYKLNCKVIVINNKGYASIRNSQASFLNGHVAASSEETGVTFPDWKKIADAYSIPYMREERYSRLAEILEKVAFVDGSLLIEIVIPENVVMIPAVTSKRLDDGTFKSNSLHEMSPFLSKEMMEEIGIF